MSAVEQIHRQRTNERGHARPGKYLGTLLVQHARRVCIRTMPNVSPFLGLEYIAHATVSESESSALSAARVTVAHTGPVRHSRCVLRKRWVAWKLGLGRTGTQKQNGGTPSVAGRKCQSLPRDESLGLFCGAPHVPTNVGCYLAGWACPVGAMGTHPRTPRRLAGLGGSLLTQGRLPRSPRLAGLSPS